MARDGYDVWTMDHDGYGHSGSSGNNSDIASGVEDLKAAMPVVAEGDRPAEDAHLRHVVGRDPRRRLRAGRSRSASTGWCCRPSPTRATARAEIARRRKRIDELRANPRRKRDAAMIRSIFTRDGHASAYDPAVAEAIVADGDEVRRSRSRAAPISTWRRTCRWSIRRRCMSPVLMMRGEHDGNSTNDDLLDFYRQLPNGDRQFVILPHTAHSPGYSKNRHLLWYAVKNFLAAPAPVASSSRGSRHAAPRQRAPEHAARRLVLTVRSRTRPIGDRPWSRRVARRVTE